MQHAYERLSVGLFSEELDEAIVLLFASLIFFCKQDRFCFIFVLFWTKAIILTKSKQVVQIEKQNGRITCLLNLSKRK